MVVLWLALARALPIGDLEREVARRKRGERPRKKGDGLGTPRTRFRIQLHVRPEVHLVFQKALGKMMIPARAEASAG